MAQAQARLALSAATVRETQAALGRLEEVEIILALPNATTFPPPYRVVVAQHGFGGSNRFVLDVAREVTGDEHAEVAKWLNNLGSCYSDKGEYDRAIDGGPLRSGAELITRLEGLRVKPARHDGPLLRDRRSKVAASFLVRPHQRWRDREAGRDLLPGDVEHHQVLRTRREMLTAALRENQALQARVQALEPELGQPQTPRAP